MQNAEFERLKATDKRHNAEQCNAEYAKQISTRPSRWQWLLAFGFWLLAFGFWKL